MPGLGSMLAAVLRHAPLHVVLKDREGRYLAASRTYRHALGLGGRRLRGRRPTEILGEAIGCTISAADRAVLAGGEARRDEIALPRPSGVRRIELTRIPLRDATGRVVGLVALGIDVTAREQAEACSREYLAVLRNFFEQAPFDIAVKDRAGRYQAVSTHLRRSLGRDSTAIRGRTAAELYPAATAEAFAAHDREVLARGRVVTRTQRVPHRGAERIVLDTKFPLRNAAGRTAGIGTLGIDITDQVRAEEALRGSRDEVRALLQRLDRAREEERRRLARNLHDDLGQLMTALRMDVAWMRDRLAPGEVELHARCARMDGAIRELAARAHKLSRSLRPPALEDLGLASTLEMLAEEVHQRFDLKCALVLEPGAEGRLGRLEWRGPEALAIVRIVQEALTNVARHAGAGRAEVRLRPAGEGLRIEVRDDGVGFDPRALARTHRLGLLGMHERALAIGATLEIEARPGAGTRVVLDLPAEIGSGEEGRR